MNINLDHPSFITFLDQVTKNVLSNIIIENYFTLTPKKKQALQYAVFKLMKNSTRIRARLSENELRSFVIVLRKKNEESENYELASILNDISSNFDTVYELSLPKKRVTKKEKSETGE